MAQAGLMRGAASAARRPQLGVGGVRAVTIVALVAAWECLAFIGDTGILYKDVVPSSVDIVRAIWAEITDAGFYTDFRVTFAEVAVGFVWGSVIAIFVGIAMGANPFLRRALEPYLNALGSTPKIIFLPILFLIFGTGIESKMAKGALSAFFPVVFTTTLGMTLISPVLIRVGRSFNLTRRQMISKIYLPAMVDPLITGLRLGFAIAIIGVLVAELKFADSGLGFRIGNYYAQFEIASMYANIIIIFALAAAANAGMTALQSRLGRYRSGPAKGGLDVTAAR